MSRAFVLGGFVALSGAISLTACGQAQEGTASTRRAITQSQAIASDYLKTELALSPETASRLGLERYLGPSVSYALDNHSQAGFERRRLVRIELLQRLQSRPRLPDDHPLTRDLAVAERALLDLIALEQLGYGRHTYASLRPYAIDPFSGIWIEGPVLLTLRQSINTPDEAMAYIARLRSLSAALQDTKRRLIADHASGLFVPQPLVAETLNRMALLLDGEPDGLDRIAGTFVALTRDVPGLDPDHRAQLIAGVELEIQQVLRPAYRDLADTLSELMADATDDLGMWAQPDGQNLYAAILHASLGEPVALERLHQRNMEDMVQRRTQLERALVLPEELQEQSPPRPQNMSEQLAWFETALTPVASAPEPAPDPDIEFDALTALPPQTVWQRVTRAPDSAVQADMFGRFMSLWQTQPYLLWRTEDAGELPPYRQLIEYPAISHAWQVYVWQTLNQAQEIDRTPTNAIRARQIGLVQTTLASADTGLHLNRWTLEEAISFVSENAGLSDTMSREIVLTVAARPGYHASVAIAVHRFEALSERAKAVLGEQYSETGFQRTLIQPGPRPLPFIETDIEAWYGAQLAANSER